MAIDSAEKRRSISGIPMLMPGVTMNSLKDAEWRQESGWSYSGILATTPSSPSWPTILKVGFRSRIVKKNTKPVLGE